MRSILERQQADPTQRVGRLFVGTGSKLPTLDSSARERLDANMLRRVDRARQAGEVIPTIAHFTVHDFRTAIATALQQKPFSVPPHILEAMLNHKVGSKVQRTYQRGKYVEEIGEGLVVWNKHLDDLAGDPNDWPGGPDLPILRLAEAKRMSALFRKGWPKKSKGDDE